MQSQPVRLPILLVPLKAQPFQTFENRRQRLLGVAFQIGVVDPQYHGAPVTAGVEPVEYKSARAADVQIARRRRRKPQSEHEIAV